MVKGMLNCPIAFSLHATFEHSTSCDQPRAPEQRLTGQACHDETTCRSLLRLAQQYVLCFMNIFAALAIMFLSLTIPVHMCPGVLGAHNFKSACKQASIHPFFDMYSC